jgi:2-haloacid dehalogenase
MMPIQAVVFDAYGTLFDVTSVGRAVAQVTDDAAQFAATWRAKQIEYTWLRTLMNRYAPFDQVTNDALRYTVARYKLDLSAAQHDALMRAWLDVLPFPDSVAALPRLSGRKRAILSNGTPAMLDAMVEAAQLADQFDAVLSVETVQQYKPHPAVYALVEQMLGVKPHETAFVSSNAWDVAGAAAFGLRVVWINRAGLPMEELGAQSEAVVGSLHELLDVLEDMNHKA